MKQMERWFVVLFALTLTTSAFAQQSPFKVYFGPSVETIVRSNLADQNRNQNHDLFAGGFAAIEYNKFELKGNFATVRGTPIYWELASAPGNGVDTEANVMTLSLLRQVFNRKLMLGVACDILTPDEDAFDNRSSFGAVVESHLPLYRSTNLVLGLTTRNYTDGWVDWSGVYFRTGIEFKL